MEKEKILIVDDSEMNRSILADMLDDYDIVEAENGVQAISILSKEYSTLSLVLLDIVMPQLDGFGVMEAMNQNGWIDDIPVIIISAVNGSAEVERAYELGATDFIARPFDGLIVHRRVVNTLLLYAKQKRLIRIIEEQVNENERHNDLMIDILSRIVEFRNGESGEHIQQVRMLTELLLNQLVQKTDRYLLTASDISLICTASALHDIGKIVTDEKILNKPGRLTPEEFEIMKKHAQAGAEILSKLKAHQAEPIVKTAMEICRWHHERYDGKGYPDGLSGDEIPISAQVVALADVYDALTSKRVYKPPYTHKQAINMILNGECGAFNPILLECLTQIAPQLQNAKEGGTTNEFHKLNLNRISSEKLDEDGGVSKRTLRLLDKERMKNSFFASMTQAIQFEYTISPSMIKLSPWGAKKLGADEIIMNPDTNEKLFTILDRDMWNQLSKLLYSSTPDKPEIKLDCLLRYENGTRWNRIVLRSMWSDDDIPKLEGCLGTVIDIHDSHSKIEELAEKASHDPLTGLLNRASARDQIELKMTNNPESNFALAIIDLDFFKSANDSYGHGFGDKVLLQISQKLTGCTRATDISCRLGGDEFLLFLEYKTDIEKTINRIFNELCSPCGQFDISVSMGIALAQDVGLSYDALFHAADDALYNAKRAGRGQYVFYSNPKE
ncbi:MAG: diguanylate cyclase [Eubacterium sp.]|nr:diguanylate cyclase [Eubacterium sp.]